MKPPRIIKIVKYIFAAVGGGMLIGTLFICKNTINFLEASIAAPGTVVELISVSSEGHVTYKPIIQFTDQQGNKVWFSSAASSNPPSYDIGEKVEILYDPEFPNHAKIKGLFSLWAGTIVIGSMAAVFSIVGAIIFILDKRK